MTDKDKAREMAENNCNGYGYYLCGEYEETSEPECYKSAVDMAAFKDKQYNSTERGGFIDVIATKLLYLMDVKGYSATDTDWEQIRAEFLEYIRNQQ